MNNGVKRIAVLGPESTGKSVLTEFLAGYYDAPWVSEYARNYLHSLDYSETDLLKIMETQSELQEKAAQGTGGMVFFDTEAIVLKIWSEEVFGSADNRFEDRIIEQKVDLYLLTFYDLEWEEDPLREGRTTRKFLFDRYRSELELHGFRYAIIRGDFFDRAYSAIQAVESIIS